MPAFVNSSAVALRAGESEPSSAKWFDEGVRVLAPEQRGRTRLLQAGVGALGGGTGIALFEHRVRPGQGCAGDVLPRPGRVGGQAFDQRRAGGEEHRLGVRRVAVHRGFDNLPVPLVEDRYGSKAENFGWFKVVSQPTRSPTWSSGASISSSAGRPSSSRTCRPSLAGWSVRGWIVERRVAKTARRGSRTCSGSSISSRTAPLALDIFTVIEDGRLDARVKAEYPGHPAGLRHASSRTHSRGGPTYSPCRCAGGHGGVPGQSQPSSDQGPWRRTAGASSTRRSSIAQNRPAGLRAAR